MGENMPKIEISPGLILGALVILGLFLLFDSDDGVKESFAEKMKAARALKAVKNAPAN